MKFIPGHFNVSGDIIIDDKEFESDIISIYEELRGNDNKDNHKVFLYLPSDYPGHGVPNNPNVSRELYLTNPARYGVAIYKSWTGKITHE